MAAALSNSEFKLIGPSGREEQPRSAVTLSCHLSPEVSAVGMEIRWFKETDCVCLYKNRQVTEGRSFEDRVSLITQELQRGNVSLQIRSCRRSERGDYLCQVISGDTTEECTIRIFFQDIPSSYPDIPWHLRREYKKVIVTQEDREWTDEERIKMEESALLTELNNLMVDRKAIEEKIQKNDLLREKESEVQEMMILLEQHKTELKEKHQQLEEKERLLRERYTQLIKREKQMQEKDRLLEERNRRKTDPDPSAPVRRWKSMWLEPSNKDEPKPSYTDAAELLSADTKLFIPEETEVTSGDGTTTCYRFQCPHAGLFQCKITSLVFEMKGKGEVLYRIVSWDARLLDGLGQMQPAGPLYDIDCKGLISHLHLPHCEILSDESQQTVAHFTAGNVEIIPPLRVTTTHVIIRIQAFSLFGLLRNLFSANPISGQVLLFHKKLSVRQRMSKLNIHLLPRNVPVEEVMKKHPSSKYIDTSSKCQLTPGRKYRPSCDPYTSQPEDETFECDYGPNYHPTFEVFIDIDAEDAKIGLLDEDELEVWKPRLVFLTDISAQGVKLQTEAEWAAFVDDHREQLIQRVSSVMEILDCLEKQKMISKEMYDNIKVTKPPQEQMRMLYNVLHSGGRSVKVEFYKILKKKQQLLVDELEAGPSQA